MELAAQSLIDLTSNPLEPRRSGDHGCLTIVDAGNVRSALDAGRPGEHDAARYRLNAYGISA
jgi:hypothetical protein